MHCVGPLSWLLGVGAKTFRPSPASAQNLIPVTSYFVTFNPNILIYLFSYLGKCTDLHMLLIPILNEQVLEMSFSYDVITEN